MNTLVSPVEHAALVVLGFLIGACAALLYQRWRNRDGATRQIAAGQRALDQARQQSELIVRDARIAASEEALKLHEEAEEAMAAYRTERLELERRLDEREKLINSQLERIVEAENNFAAEKQSLRDRLNEVAARERELAVLAEQAREKLEKLAGLTPAAARETLLKQVEAAAVADANKLARHIIEDAKIKAEDKARQIISVAIARYAGEHTFSHTTTSIALPNGEDLKGRIIGREGRNIRAFEAATGVTVLIDDTPGTVLLSGFDPVRREVAREAMARLIADGRIHPARIEEVVAKANEEMRENIRRLGQDAVTRAGITAMGEEIVNVLGRLHFRHSYAQNLLDHSVEVAHLMGLMAAELGLDVMSAKRAGLLHDIGKALNHEIEGPHAVVGADFIKRHGEAESVVNAVASHHNDVPPVGPLGILVGAADAISASRPGARSENMTTYLKRVEDLEKIAAGFPGVERAFAAQAGRELRVFVHPQQVDDDQAFSLARSLAAKIESDLQYPGQIKITVIRETRCIEVAK